MKIYEDGVYREATNEELEQIEANRRKQEVYEKHRQLTDQEVIDLFISKQINTLSFDDNVSLRMIDKYPLWEDLAAQNVQLTDDDFENFKFTYQGKLYKVIKPHTFSSAWVPGVGTESLYVRIDEVYQGTLEDPIPYNGNMILEKDKYYIQDNVIYKCTRDSGNPLYNDLKDLINLYVEKV